MQKKWGWLFLAAGLILPVHALAWNKTGHAAVAKLAEANLTPTVESQVKTLLQDDIGANGQPSGAKNLADVSVWPDQIRTLGPKDAYKGWHVRGNPVCSDSLGPCPDGHCVDQLIVHYAHILGDRSVSKRERNEALKWVVHLVGDLHMPLHSGNNADGSGSFPIQYDGVDKPMTLHQAWDDLLPKLVLQSGPLQGHLDPALPHLAVNAPEQWMRETRTVALHAAYEPLPSFTCGIKPKQPVKIDDAYLQQAVAPAREQMQKAGLRLAQLLNETLAEPVPLPAK